MVTVLLVVYALVACLFGGVTYGVGMTMGHYETRQGTPWLTWSEIVAFSLLVGCTWPVSVPFLVHEGGK